MGPENRHREASKAQRPKWQGALVGQRPSGVTLSTLAGRRKRAGLKPMAITLSQPFEY